MVASVPLDLEEILKQINAQRLTVGISFFSLGVSAFSLGWNIYRDIIMKPRLQVRVSVSHLITPGTKQKDTYVWVQATNFGPGPVHCKMVVLKNAPLWRRLIGKTQHAVTMSDYTNPYNARLPAKLDVGESIDLLFPYKKECFLGQRFTAVGVLDSFGRSHWARRKQYVEAQATFRKDLKEGVVI